MSAERRADVLVVGAGSAAYAAAIAARQCGAAHVDMLEKAPSAEAGGNARYSRTIFRFAHDGPTELRAFLPDLTDHEFQRLHMVAYTPDDYVRDLMSVTHGRMNPRLGHTLALESNAAMHWMLEQGVRWQAIGTGREVDADVFFDDPGFILSPIGGGPGLLAHWRLLAESLGIKLQCSAQVTGFLGTDRQVDGVHVTGPRADYDVEADRVILCSGGFQASPRLRARYLGANADLLKIQGSPYDTGEVLMAALQLGAEAAGQWQGADAVSVDGSFPDVEPSPKARRGAYELGITVNIHGQRFFDESTGESETRDTPWVVLSQPGGVAYQVFDRRGAAQVPIDYGSGGPMYRAESIASLADQIGINPAALERTVGLFNATVCDGDMSARYLVPPRARRAEPLDEPPFVAVPVTAGITFTFGGLEVNSDAQVMNQRGEPIRGLYASGDIIGLYFHHHHLRASGQMRNVVFSRLAAKHAVQSL